MTEYGEIHVGAAFTDLGTIMEEEEQEIEQK